MDWRNVRPAERRAMVQAVCDTLNASGTVREAYYRIDDGCYPVVYARLVSSDPALDNVLVTFQDNAVEDIANRLAEKGN